MSSELQLISFFVVDFALPIHEPEANAAAKRRLIEALRTGRLVGMTGAGLSAWAGYPVWNVAIDRLARLLTQITGDAQQTDDLLNRNRDDLLFCAKRLGREIGHERFADFIAMEFGPKGQPPPDILIRFALLPLRHILTLNFDVSCEAGHSAAGAQHRQLSSSKNESLVSFFRNIDHPACEKSIFHLHGKFDDDLNNIALTEDGYRRLYDPGSLFRHHFTHLAISQSLLFAGFGFTDNDVTRIFADAARLVQGQLFDQIIHYHFAIIGLELQDTHENDDRPRRTTMSDRFLTDSVFYNIREGDNPHSEFADLIQEISNALGTVVPTPLQPAGPVEVVPADDIQRMVNMRERFIQRVNRGQDDV